MIRSIRTATARPSCLSVRFRCGLPESGSGKHKGASGVSRERLSRLNRLRPGNQNDPFIVLRSRCNGDRDDRSFTAILSSWDRFSSRAQRRERLTATGTRILNVERIGMWTGRWMLRSQDDCSSNRVLTYGKDCCANRRPGSASKEEVNIGERRRFYNDASRRKTHQQRFRLVAERPREMI